MKTNKLMANISAQLNPKRWILSGFVITIPTLIFWCAVAYSVLTHNHQYVDAMLAHGGRFTHIMFAAILPLLSFCLAVISRMGLRRQAIARNVWHRETPEMKVNQGLINWNVLLISVMIISLINN